MSIHGAVGLQPTDPFTDSTDSQQAFNASARASMAGAVNDRFSFGSGFGGAAISSLSHREQQQRIQHADSLRKWRD
jgi:hypothetical protein